MGEIRQLCVSFGIIWRSSVFKAVDMGAGKEQKYLDAVMDYPEVTKKANGLGTAYRRSNLRAYAKEECMRFTTIAMEPSKSFSL